VTRGVTVAVSTALSLTAPVFAQQPPPAVHLVQPTAQSILSRHSDFEAAVDLAASDVRYVAFFVDGQQVCRVAVRPYRCTWDAGPEAIPRSVRAVAELRDGRRLVSTVRTAARDPSVITFGTSVDAVSVPVRVHTRRGQPVGGVTADSFRLLEDGEPQTVQAILAEKASPSLMLALDMSSSMSPILPDLRRAAEVFLDGVKGYPSVSLAAFNNGLFVLSRPGSDHASRRSAVGRLRPFGATALYDSLIRAIDLVKTQPPPRAIAAFTDGEEVASSASIDSVRLAFLGADVALYLVVRADEPDGGSPQALLATIARETGGAAWFTSRMTSLTDRFSEVVRDLTTRYVLSYTPSRPLGDGEWRRLEVEVAGASRDYVVQHRQGYFAVSRTRSGATP
jgi:VWFA-related protein